ncbi:MAG: HAD family hydrolase [Planctomycetota bacterium]|jgi:beta-phosphoglucomutase
MKYKAIFFDFDGVIGKTMEDNYNAWACAFSTVGITLEKVDYFLLEGLDTKSVAKIILRRNKLDESLTDEVVTVKEKHYLEHNSFEFYPGIVDFINSLDNQFKLALVSGATAERLKSTVPPDFLKKFGTVITGDKVRNPKPSPEPYLLASEQLEVPPSECLVIENAPLGIASAKKAGMDCAAVCSTLEHKYLAGADFIVDSAYSLSTFFQDINER